MAKDADVFVIAAVNRYHLDMATAITKAHRAFPSQAFICDALKGYDDLALMQRGRQIATAMREHLPADYAKAINILVRSFGPKNERWDGGDDTEGLGSFFYLPHVFFIAEHGLDHFEASMAAQYELTQRFTAEWSIRPYLEQYPDRKSTRLNSSHVSESRMPSSA